MSDNEFSPLPTIESPQELADGLLLQVRSLTDSEFIVKRNGYPEQNIPERFEQGWNIKTSFIQNDIAYVRIEKSGAHKTMPAEWLLSWQPVDSQDEAEVTLPRIPEFEYVEQSPVVGEVLADVALRQTVEVDAEQSVDMLKANQRIADIIGETGAPHNPLAEQLINAGASPDAIRLALADTPDGSALRTDVKHVLTQRMSQLLSEGGHFHERVQDNSPLNLKAPNGNHGYKKAKYQSDEYVVLLALAKLDGSFDTSKEKDYTDLPDRHVHQGQHRQASNELLASFVSENEGTAEIVQEPTENDALNSARRTVSELIKSASYSVRTLDSMTESLQQVSRSEMIDLQQVHETLGMIRMRTEALAQQIQTALQSLRNIETDIDVRSDDDRRTQQSIEDALYSMLRMHSIVDQDVMDSIQLLIRKTDEAHYERHMQLDYRSSLFQRSQQLSETIHSVLTMLYRTEL